MSKVQYYGLSYPFKSTNDENFFLNVNYDLKDKVRSLIMHVVFTPKGQKLRDPEFGTNLIRYIFEQGDLFTFENIKDEVSMAIKKYAHGITINDISILESGDDLSKIFVRIDYSVMNGLKTINDSIVTQI